MELEIKSKQTKKKGRERRRGRQRHSNGYATPTITIFLQTMRTRISVSTLVKNSLTQFPQSERHFLPRPPPLYVCPTHKRPLNGQVTVLDVWKTIKKSFRFLKIYFLREPVPFVSLHFLLRNHLRGIRRMNRFPITYNVIFIFIRPDNGSEIETLDGMLFIHPPPSPLQLSLVRSIFFCLMVNLFESG